MSRPNATRCPHTDRVHRAKGLCGSCYVLGKPGGEIALVRYGDELVEELEHFIRPWPELEQMFGRSRDKMLKVLYARGEQGAALVRRVHLATYGVATQPEIMSSLRSGKRIGEW